MEWWNEPVEVEYVYAEDNAWEYMEVPVEMMWCWYD